MRAAVAIFSVVLVLLAVNVLVAASQESRFSVTFMNALFMFIATVSGVLTFFRSRQLKRGPTRILKARTRLLSVVMFLGWIIFPAVILKHLDSANTEASQVSSAFAVGLYAITGVLVFGVYQAILLVSEKILEEDSAEASPSHYEGPSKPNE